MQPQDAPHDVSPRSLGRRCLHLGLWLFVGWFFLWQITPFLLLHIPALARYREVCEENDITPGALYYTDVPVSGAAERDNRDTVRFLPRNAHPPSR